jgi:predicted PhzF superfamily epimerase YddE/YHI9
VHGDVLTDHLFGGNQPAVVLDGRGWSAETMQAIAREMNFSEYSRMFAPGLRIVEDPATGSASGPLGCYLVRHGVAAPADAGAMLTLQGVKMGRPSHVHISIGGTDDEITSVRVGGESSADRSAHRHLEWELEHERKRSAR